MNEIIRKGIKHETFSKRYNILAEYSHDGGFDLFNSLSLISFEPNLGSLVKLNLKSVNSNSQATESVLILKRKNTLTYNIHFGFAIFFFCLTFVIAAYHNFLNEINSLQMFILPFFGIIYILLIEISAKSKISNLIKQVERIMEMEKIEYEIV